MHTASDGSVVIRAFLPGASRVDVLDGHSGQVLGPMELIHDWGFYAVHFPDRRELFRYRFRVDFGSSIVDTDDPYRFWPLLGDVDAHLFAEGTHWRIYERLGAHPTVIDGVEGVMFAVWAPNARRVSVVGTFNAWDGRRHPMRLRVEFGVWELFLPKVQPGDLYKFEIKGAFGDLLPLKADPFGRACEPPPGNASIVQGKSGHRWEDGEWMGRRAKTNPMEAPMVIYEIHLGSWKRKPEEGNRYLTYRELADDLALYLKETGFTHIELLPVTEHPFDGSWGYQPTGLFAPTWRFGTPDDFRYMVDRLHQAGIGVFMDWVPGHFPTDAHGLVRFDGTAMYEHEDPRQGFHKDWNTLIYNFGRSEVANFLIANALYWIDEFHIDGLRVDAVASMLYNDYSRQPGEWIPNYYGGNENLEAIHFMRRLNEKIYESGSGAITMAEESTAWPMVSRPTSIGGLGFGFKWNMGWMHDTLKYMSKDPVHRRFHHDHLTFGMLYGYSENFILALSHDEVVHGKRSLLDRMSGDAWQKFANLRVYFTFMWGFPGKKLLFMGGEFAQGREWNHDTSLDWHLLNEVAFHRGVWRLVRELNRIYQENSCFYERDHEPGGFEWIDCHDFDQSVISMLRINRRGQIAIVVCNFTPVVREHYRLGVPKPGLYIERLNSDAVEYCGSGVGNMGAVHADDIEIHGRPFSISVNIPPLGGLILIPEQNEGW
ncbi:MAG: 1,4-alpha-glucan branching protein GlgB [Magnetococcales bacterium]|nr:1,4-alpha-glucan branching protein GlgB [Magnetococcales bacterium]MBF0157290.1 1,4-alpha-glucan branching protein GlgB [Magnetococcales bacterium]